MKAIKIFLIALVMTLPASVSALNSDHIWSAEKGDLSWHDEGHSSPGCARLVADSNGEIEILSGDMQNQNFSNGGSFYVLTPYANISVEIRVYLGDDYVYTYTQNISTVSGWYKFVWNFGVYTGQATKVEIEVTGLPPGAEIFIDEVQAWGSGAGVFAESFDYESGGEIKFKTFNCEEGKTAIESVSLGEIKATLK
ncbi:hypothetical protein ACFLZS_00980 [Patescibacteria group bacterium]